MNESVGKWGIQYVAIRVDLVKRNLSCTIFEGLPFASFPVSSTKL